MKLEKCKTLQDFFRGKDGEKRWTKGAYARTQNGRRCGIQSPKAVCWCLSGAIEKLNLTHLSTGLIPVIRANGLNVAFYSDANDSPQTTIADIRRWVKAANV